MPSARDKPDPAWVAVTRDECPPLPDDVLTNPHAGHLDPGTWFPDPTLPLEIEIGPGKGGFLVHHAAAQPDTNILAIEWEYEVFALAADRVRRRDLRNVRMLMGNGVDFLRWRVPDARLRTIHLYFSDPWPKQRHHKNRVVQHRFLLEAARTLEPGGELRIVTDHDDLWAWDLAHIRGVCVVPESEIASALAVAQESSGLDIPAAPPEKPLFAYEPFVPPDWVVEGELVGTNYERKFKRDDRPAHACVLRRIT